MASMNRSQQTSPNALAETPSALNVDWESVNQLLPGLREIAAEWPDRFAESGPKVHFTPAAKHEGFTIQREADRIRVEYSIPRDAYRAIGVLLGDSKIVQLEERSSFPSLGVMLDVSRNAVLKPEALQYFIRRFALMGINSVQLYMEDVYALEDEPFFGYARGPYSPDELRQLDAYAAKFNIELIPCIQTLGHLTQVLQWPAYADLVDSPGVLLVGEAKVYNLVRKMLETLSGCFRSRRIHIGMDEAHGLGLGRYRRLHGENRAFDLINQHLEAVTTICDSLGLQPMIWSDMYFRIGSQTNDYYDPSSRIPDEVPGRIPAQVDLVYWDYVHTDQAFYEEWIDRHRAMGKTPIFATAGWSQKRFWARLPTAFQRISAGMNAARKKALGEAFITLWGDDGAECVPVSVLPAIQYFTDCAYGRTADEGDLEKRLLGSCRSNLAPLLLGAELDALPDGARSGTDTNFSKWILWHDPVLSFLADCIPDGMTEHYRQLSARLEAVEDRTVPISLAQTLARLLIGKTRLHLEVRSAYETQNREALAELKDEVLPGVIDDVERLLEIHRVMWHSWYKPFGWEVLDRRYGGLLARLKSLGLLLKQSLQNPGLRIPEFEYELQKLDSVGTFRFARTSFPTQSH